MGSVLEALGPRGRGRVRGTASTEEAPALCSVGS